MLCRRLHSNDTVPCYPAQRHCTPYMSQMLVIRVGPRLYQAPSTLWEAACHSMQHLQCRLELAVLQVAAQQRQCSPLGRIAGSGLLVVEGLCIGIDQCICTYHACPPMPYSMQGGVCTGVYNDAPLRTCGEPSHDGSCTSAARTPYHASRRC